MELRDHDDAREFLEFAAPLLAADEARHSLGFAICGTLIHSPETYRRFHLWTVAADGRAIAAAVMTPPFNLWLARPAEDAAVPFLASELAGRGIELPGVTAAVPEVERLADEWESLRPVRRRLRLAQGIYAVREPRVPSDVPGRMRPAEEADRPLLVGWIDAFVAEALPDDAVHHDPSELVDQRLRSRSGGFVVWEDAGTVVSLAGYAGETPNGIRVGLVYTPPEFRGRGYASAVTAQLSARLLAEGRRYCFLYTDLANPTSNRIYRNIGYELVAESADYAFDARA